ncbi:MAG: GMC family oxidoreductase N-terminal domain-containing protein [Hyphomonadaceae bacterium]
MSRPPGHPVCKAFIQAGAQAGYPVTRGFNGHQQKASAHITSPVRDGERWARGLAYFKAGH